MAIQQEHTARALDVPVIDVDSAFDPDVSIVESGPLIDELIQMTDDNCGRTCESACVSCND